jgi:hypothetical protein
MAGTGDQQLLARIGFAERWLNRARRQCTEGNLARGVLTLVLADAEVHHALAAAGLPPKANARRVNAAVICLAGVALVSAVLLTSRWSAPSGTAMAVSAPPLVRLPSSSGALLEAMDVLTSTPQVAHSSAAAVGASARGSLLTPGPALTTTPRLALTGLLRPPGGPGSSLPVRIGPSHLSTTELIELVLTAERALRQKPTGFLSP